MAFRAGHAAGESPPEDDTPVEGENVADRNTLDEVEEVEKDVNSGDVSNDTFARLRQASLI